VPRALRVLRSWLGCASPIRRAGTAPCASQRSSFTPTSCCGALGTARGLTLRSSADCPRRAVLPARRSLSMLPLAGKPSHRGQPLSSNVRPTRVPLPPLVDSGTTAFTVRAASRAWSGRHTPTAAVLPLCRERFAFSAARRVRLTHPPQGRFPVRLSAKFGDSTCLPRRARHRTGPNPSLKHGLSAAGRLGRASLVVYAAPHGQAVPPRPAA